MKRTYGSPFRKMMGILLAVCLLVVTLSPAMADEPDSENPYYQKFTGGETDESHSAENEPLGDLALPEEFEAPYAFSYAALSLRFLHGGGNVTMKTGKLTTTKAIYNESGFFNYLDYYSCGADIVVTEQSTLKLDTGEINSKGRGINAVATELSTLEMKVNGDVLGEQYEGIYANVEYPGSQVSIEAGDVTAGTIGVNVGTSLSTADNSENTVTSEVSCDTVYVKVDNVISGESGIFAGLRGGTITVNSGAVKALGGNGVDVSVSGEDVKDGATITVDGTVESDGMGIIVSSMGDYNYAEYDNGEKVLADFDDPHENWWEKTHIDETGYYVLVSVDTEDGVVFEKYLRYDENSDEYTNYSEEDIQNYEVFKEYVDWEYVYVIVNPANFVKVTTTGGVTAGETGINADNNGGNFDIAVKGDVTVSQTEADLLQSGDRSHELDGVFVTNQGSTKILIDGNIDVSIIESEEEESQTTNPEDLEEDPEGVDDEEEERRFVGNVVTIINIDGETEVAVKGNLTAKNGTAVIIRKEFLWDDSETYNGDAVLNIDGNVTAENGIDCEIDDFGKSHVVINIGGDLATSGTGLSLGTDDVDLIGWNDGSDKFVSSLPAGIPGDSSVNAATSNPAAPVDITVHGSISGLIPIYVANEDTAKNISITAWKIEPNDFGQITNDIDGNSVESVEKNIYYMVKTESSELGSIYVGCDETENVKMLNAEDALFAAQEGTTLKVGVTPANTTVASSIKIYNGTGDDKTELQKDENGDYFLTVPKGGGIYLTFSAETVSYAFVNPPTSWTKGSGQPLAFTIKRSVDDENCINYYRSLKFGNKDFVLNTDYTAAKGSTVLTIPAETLEEFEPGVYKVAATFAVIDPDEEDSITIETELTINPAPEGGNDTEGTEGTTTEGTEGTTTDGTEGTTTDGTEGTTTDGTEGTTTDGTEGTTTDGTEGTTTDGTEGTTPSGTDETKPAATDETKPAATDETKPAATDETKPAATEETKPAATDDTKPAATDETKPAATDETKPAATEETKPAATDETKPAATEETKPAVTEETKPATEETKPAPADNTDSSKKDQSAEKTDGPNTSDTMMIGVLIAMMISSGAAAFCFATAKRRVRR